MSQLTVDKTKCKQDGICAMECPRLIIDPEGDDGYPVISAGSEARCMACGHCLAVCPQKALSHSDVTSNGCLEVDKDLVLNWDQAHQFLRSRRSIRRYKDKPVDHGTMERLIKAASYAPTASNDQNLHWTIIEDKELLHKLSEETIKWMKRLIKADPDSPTADYFKPAVAGWESGYDPILRSAPGLVTASAPKYNTNGLVDISIALSYLELAALPEGVGTCWAGLLRAAMVGTPEIVEMMGIPEGHTWFYPMMIGYPKFKYHQMPERNAPNITWK